MAMNEQKEAFARARVSGLSNKEAAIAAGYSAKTASACGSRLAKDEDVRAEIARLQSARDVAPIAAPTPDVPSVFAEHAPVDSDVTSDLVGLTERGRRLRDAGILTVKGFTVEVDGKAFDILANPKDQADLCRMGIIYMDNQQRDMAKSTLPYHHGKVADMGKKDVAQQAAQQAVGGRFSPMAPPKAPQGTLFS